MLKIIKKLLLTIIDNIDSGNCELSEQEALEIIAYINNISNKDKKLSKYQACEMLNCSRATFDNLIVNGKLPKGIKEPGFKELFWKESTIRNFIMYNK